MLTDHIAVAMDFSETSDMALRAALRLAERTSAKRVTVIHACRKVVLPHESQESLRHQLEDIQNRLIDTARRTIDGRVAELGSRPVEHEIVAGRPTEVIPEAVHRIGATLLVLGTHARRGIRRMFMGSVAEAVLLGLRVPGLVMTTGGDGAPPDVEMTELDRILVAADLTAAAELAANTAAELATALDRHHASVTLFHCVDHHGFLGSLDAEDDVLFAHDRAAREHLESIAQRVLTRAPDMQIDVTIGEGDPPEAIVAKAEAIGAEVIVVGAHQKNDLGSVAEQVIRHAPMTVLVVPGRDGL